MVPTTGNVIGSAAFELRVDKRKAQQDVKEFENDFQRSLKGMEAEGGRAAGGIGGAFSKLGLTVGAAVGALVAGLALAAAGITKISFEAVRFASDIAKTAGAIGISTSALQEWRFVATQTGADAKDADRALDSFANKLAQATAGTSKEAVKAFSFLGIDREQLRGFKSFEEALDTVTDGIKDLRSEADRAAVAEALGLGPLSSALRDGAVDIAALRDEARALGVVMDAELIRRASKAQEEFDTLSSVIDIQLKSAFIDLAPAIMAAIQLVAQLATALGDAMDRFRDLDSRTARGLRLERQALLEERDNIVAGSTSADGRVLPLGGRRIVATPVPGANYSPVAQQAGVDGFSLAGQRAVDLGEHFDALNRRITQVDSLIAQRTATDGPRTRTDRPDGGILTLPPERQRVDRTAEREARRAERVEQEIFRARQRLLDVAEGDLLTARERWDLARDQLEADRQARDAEIESKQARGEYKKAEADRLRLANEEADLLEDRILTDTSLRDIRDEELANARILADITAELIGLQSGAARTAAERERLELQLLEITQKQRRDTLDKELNDTPGLTDADRQDAWDRNRQVEGAERAAVQRRNMGPLEAWRDASLRTAAEISEAYEGVAANGLDALNDGLVDAIVNSKNLGDMFSNVAKQILADLLKISVRRGIIEPFANAVFGGSGGGFGGFGGGGGSSGGSNWFAAAFQSMKGMIPGFSSGVTNFGGGLAYVHAGEILANLPQGTDVIPAHAVPALGGGKGSMRVVVTTNDDRFNAYVDERAAPQAASAFSTARQAVPADLARQERYTLGRRR